MTLREAADILAAQLGQPITPQQVYYWAKRKSAAAVGSKRIKVLREIEVDAVSAQDLPVLERYARAALDGYGVASETTEEG